MKNHSRSRPALLLALCALVIGIAVWFPRREHKSTPANPKNHTVRNDRTFEDFGKWVETFSQTDASRQAALTNTGLELARARRVRMEALILDDPQAAIANAVTLDVWKSLPPELQREVEEPFSALGNFRVLPVCGDGTPSRNVVRYTEIDGQPALGSSVFGRRLTLTTKENSPVQGIRLGGIAALREEVFHRLEPRETTVAESLYPIANPLPDRDFSTGQPLGTHPVTTLSGGRIFKFSDQDSLETFEKNIAALDAKPGPRSGAAVLFMAMPTSDTQGAFNLARAVVRSGTLNSTWTENRKKVLMIRCDFSDYPNSSNPVVAQATYETLLNTTVSDDIRDFSYAKTWIEAIVSSDITRLPQTASYYAAVDSFNTSRNTDLLANAKSAYLTAHPGFNYAAYDIVGIWFTSIGMKSGGLAYAGLAGGSDIWIQNSTDAGVHVHEFGHNYGIGHSSFWIPSVGSTDPVDPSGTYEEYGDPFDVMGKGTVPEGVYHAEAKQRLDWLSPGHWTDATVSGTYRIKRIDNVNTTGVRGLRVAKSGNDHYWLSYRRLFSNSWLKAGANIVWEQSLYGRSWLIDTTPGSLAGSADRTDGSLAIGRTYSDTAANVHITALARGGTSPDEYLDVKVNIGPFPGNSAPTATLSGPSTISARQSCIFTAQAGDPNDDELAYSWDFGQGFTFDNHSTAAWSWNSGGTYTVKLTVSDMKGLSTTVTKVVTVTDPITTWSARTNTSTGDFTALAASPGKVIAVGQYFAGNFKGPVATSPDGTTWTSTELGANQQAGAAVWDGTKFILAGQEYDFVAPAGWRGCILTSPSADSGTWTRRLYTGSPLNGIAFGGGICVAVGDGGTIRRSTDGTTWSPISSGTTNTLADVAYGGGKFVAVGYEYNVTTKIYNGNCTVLTSTDGLSWTNTSSGAGTLSSQDLRYIRWTKDRFLASGWYAKVRQSSDLGVSFTTTRTANDDTPAMAYGNGVWFAAGVDDAATGSEVDIDLVSTDGTNWTPLATPSLDNRNDAVFFNNTFITVGKNHSIRQSAAIAPVSSGYPTWRETYYPDHGPLSAPDEDGDGDSLTNLLEYALGSSPVSITTPNSVGALPQAAMFSSASPLLTDRIALQFSLPEPAPADLRYVVEASSTLNSTWTPLASKTGTGAWTWNGSGTARIILGSASGGKIPVIVGDSQAASAAPARFLRLRTCVNQ